jgi:hypothetical protein
VALLPDTVGLHVPHEWSEPRVASIQWQRGTEIGLQVKAAVQAIPSLEELFQRVRKLENEISALRRQTVKDDEGSVI